MIIYVETKDGARLIDAESRAQARAYVIGTYIAKTRAATADDVAAVGSDKIEKVPSPMVAGPL